MCRPHPGFLKLDQERRQGCAGKHESKLTGEKEGGKGGKWGCAGNASLDHLKTKLKPSNSLKHKFGGNSELPKNYLEKGRGEE